MIDAQRPAQFYRRGPAADFPAGAHGRTEKVEGIAGGGAVAVLHGARHPAADGVGQRGEAAAVDRAPGVEAFRRDCQLALAAAVGIGGGDPNVVAGGEGVLFGDGLGVQNVFLIAGSH